MTDTLRELLDKLKAIDDDLAPEDFDPAQIVGDVRDKVDAIKWRIDSWDSEIEAIDAWINQLRCRSGSIARKQEKLKEYVRAEMEKHGYETLPGEIVRIDLRRSNPSVQVETMPDATTYLRYGNYVLQKIAYQWDKNKLKEAIDSGNPDLPPGVSLKESNHIRFELNKTIKKGKK